MSNHRAQNVIGNTDYYAYGGTVSSIAAGALSTVNVQVEADANFLANKFNVFASIAGAAQTDDSRVLPLVTLQIQDTGSGRNLFNTPLALPNISGYGSLPFIIPINRVFKSNTSIQFTFTNFSAATTYRLDFALIGIKQWS